MELKNGDHWADFRKLVRLQRARWTHLEPNVNDLHAALDKVAQEIITLKAVINKRDEEIIRLQDENYALQDGYK